MIAMLSLRDHVGKERRARHMLKMSILKHTKTHGESGCQGKLELEGNAPSGCRSQQQLSILNPMPEPDESRAAL